MSLDTNCFACGEKVDFEDPNTEVEPIIMFIAVVQNFIQA